MDIVSDKILKQKMFSLDVHYLLQVCELPSLLHIFTLHRLQNSFKTWFMHNIGK